MAVLPVPDCAWAMTSLPAEGECLNLIESRELYLHTLDHWHNGALLDGRRALETVGIDSAKELALEVHGIETVGGFIVVGFDLACGRKARQ